MSKLSVYSILLWIVARVQLVVGLVVTCGFVVQQAAQQIHNNIE